MNKKVIGIVVAVVIAIIVIVVAIVGLKGNREPDTIENTPPTQEEIDNAKDLQKYMPDKTVDEIVKIEQEELTKEQVDTFDEVIKQHEIPEVAEIISTPDVQNLENETPKIVYKDKDGNIIEEEITEEEWNMTDEEAAEFRRSLEEDMDRRMKEYAERWEQKQNGEEVDPITPPGPNDENIINNEVSSPENPSGGKNIYGGFNTYDEYIEYLHSLSPEYSIEQIKEAFLDPATGEVGEAAEWDAQAGLLTGN